MDGCLSGTRAAGGRGRRQIQSVDGLDPDARKLRRFFFASAAEDVPDRQGRITIPGPLAQSAGLGREVVVAGVMDHLEIWNRAAWREHIDEVEGSAEDVARRIATKSDS